MAGTSPAMTWRERRSLRRLVLRGCRFAPAVGFSDCARYILAFAHVLFGKPVPTFPEHARALVTDWLSRNDVPENKRRRSMTFKSLSLVAIAGIAICAIPAAAHHSFAMFDVEKSMTIEGTVKEFQWTNP